MYLWGLFFICCNKWIPSSLISPQLQHIWFFNQCKMCKNLLTGPSWLSHCFSKSGPDGSEFRMTNYMLTSRNQHQGQSDLSMHAKLYPCFNSDPIKHIYVATWTLMRYLGFLTCIKTLWPSATLRFKTKETACKEMCYKLEPHFFFFKFQTYSLTYFFLYIS